MGRLSKRLHHILALVPQAECVADIGTDHGYVPIWLVEQGICKRAIAMDVRKGPLQRAQDHIQEKGLGGYIETRLSDGLCALHPGEAQVIVIAGMGGNTMERILEKGAGVLTDTTILILQPQSELPEFRRFLLRQGFVFLTEDMVEEDGKYYPMMKVRRGVKQRIKPGEAGTEQPDAAGGIVDAAGGLLYNDIELMYGPVLLKQKHPVLKEFLQRQEKKQEEIAKQLRKQKTETASARLFSLEQELLGIRRALNVLEDE